MGQCGAQIDGSMTERDEGMLDGWIVDVDQGVLPGAIGVEMGISDFP